MTVTHHMQQMNHKNSQSLVEEQREFNATAGQANKSMLSGYHMLQNSLQSKENTVTTTQLITNLLNNMSDKENSQSFL